MESDFDFPAADVESVRCCLCHEPGRPLYERPPFAVVRCPRCGLVFVSPRLTSDALQRLYDEPAYFDDVVYGTSRWSPAMMLQRTWTAGRLALLREHVPPPARLLEIGSGYGHFLAAALRISRHCISRHCVLVRGVTSCFGMGFGMELTAMLRLCSAMLGSVALRASCRSRTPRTAMP